MKIVMFLLMTLALVGCTDLYDRRNHSYFRRFSENRENEDIHFSGRMEREWMADLAIEDAREMR